MNYRQCRESIGQFGHAGDVNVQIKVLNDFVDAIEFRNDDFENGCDKGHDPASLLTNRESEPETTKCQFVEFTLVNGNGRVRYYITKYGSIYSYLSNEMNGTLKTIVKHMVTGNSSGQTEYCIINISCE